MNADSPGLTAGVSLRTLLSGFTEGSAVVPDLTVSGLQLDSRAVQAGDLFVALQGHQAHGLTYAPQAVKSGAVAIIYEPAGAGERAAMSGMPVPQIAVPALAEKLGYLADRFFDQPSAALRVIGVTGTNGKTSCSHFLAEALSAQGKAGVVGTLGWGVPGRLRDTHHTTPDAIEVHRLLRHMQAEGFAAVVMEASSHGLSQGRLTGVRFMGALFTNFTRDHLDYHETMAAYLESKLHLLEWPTLEFVVFNNDSPFAEPIRARQRDSVRYLGFGAEAESTGQSDALITHGEVVHESDGIRFRVRYQGQSETLKVPVFGDFNVENITAVLAVMICLGHDFREAIDALGRVAPVPGRMEPCGAGSPGVVIDYAHTPDALESVLGSLRTHCRGKLWVVFGCGGDRDRGKRPQMGAVAERLADVIILTDDNPRGEDGDAIVHQILAGIGRRDVLVERDRLAAIRHALTHAGHDDLILIAGKGHENTQEIKGIRHHFSDREAVEGILGRPVEPVRARVN